MRQRRAEQPAAQRAGDREIGGVFGPAGDFLDAVDQRRAHADRADAAFFQLMDAHRAGSIDAASIASMIFT